ncbi:hypothetical protein ERJ75_001321700 [Trypanosoma vivax]|uniref:Putative flagellum-adhesion glycoprotein n=1 Tax=Trypanosoma vivax (strain Y486) TaxID=1055687 RepID=G0U0Y0_TRYVY|nr:hypothetical protein ERJ75_001321700 [Trypanosoma vivax]CCC49735.1 putative flagellum-adhesion glycoprotein [Trypanosoma vivax Y486]
MCVSELHAGARVQPSRRTGNAVAVSVPGVLPSRICVALAMLLCLVCPVLAANKQLATGVQRQRIILNLFNSCVTCTTGQKDGAGAVGRLFTAAGGSVSGKRPSLVLCDGGGGGSTVRVVNKSGVFTVAGSAVHRGHQDGAANQSRFNDPRAVAHVHSVYYVADKDNKRIRRIDPNGTVSTFLDRDLEGPQDVLPYLRRNGTYDLFVSDTAGSRILYAPLGANATFSTEFVKGFQPGTMQISNKRGVMYVVKNVLHIEAVDMNEQGSGNRHWPVGDSTCLNYGKALMLEEEESKLFFYSKNKGKPSIMSLKVGTTNDANARAEDSKSCPEVVLEWPHGEIVSLVRVNQYEFYAVTESDVYIVRFNDYTKTPTPQPVPTPSQATTPNNSTPQTNATSNTNRTLPKPPTPPTPPAVNVTVNVTVVDPSANSRASVVAAFASAAVPLNDTSLMHAFLSAMMRDVSIAFGTDDFFGVFQPPGIGDVHGSTNISAWTNLTTLAGHDGTVTITNYYAPPGMNETEAQDRLFDSPWYWTRKFLESLRQEEEEWEELEPFCMLDCVQECAYITYNETMCADYVPPPACDDVCIGAIVSSLLLGGMGAGLLALMVASPPNVKSALVRVPVF